MTDELVTLGNKIAELRRKRGFTQEELAELIDYSPNHLAKLENAGTNPSFDLLIKISNALNVEIKDLFDFNENLEIEYLKTKLNKIINSLNYKKIKLLYNIYRAIDK